MRDVWAAEKAVSPQYGGVTRLAKIAAMDWIAAGEAGLGTENRNSRRPRAGHFVKEGSHGETMLAIGDELQVSISEQQQPTTVKGKRKIAEGPERARRFTSSVYRGGAGLM